MADDFGDFSYDDEEEFGYDDAGVADGMTDNIDQVPDDGSEDEASRDNSPFYKAAGLLVVIFLLSLICGGISYATRGSGDETASDPNTSSQQSEEIAAIETQNAVVAVTNAAVTQTIIAMETEAATTPTPAIPPTNTPVLEPTNTLVPTATPLFQETTPNPDGDGGDNADGSDGTGDSGNDAGSSVGDGVSTPTPIPGLGSGSGDSGSGTLPETGIGAWVAALAALGLIGLFMGARKMRHV